MHLRELNIGDKFSIEQYYDEDNTVGNYLVINPNTDNFVISSSDSWFDLEQYTFVLNLDTSTLGILLLAQEVTLND